MTVKVQFSMVEQHAWGAGKPKEITETLSLTMNEGEWSCEEAEGGYKCLGFGPVPEVAVLDWLANKMGVRQRFRDAQAKREEPAHR